MINFITARQSDPLQNTILDLAVKNYNQDPTKKTFIIVPNHIKFTTEIKALNKLANLSNQNQVAVKNLQILSFSRLAWYFLRDSDIHMPQIVDDAASLMLLEQVIKEKQEDLKLLGEEAINQGTLKQLYQAILQVRQGLDLDSVKLEEASQETELKIHDLNIIYQAFEEKIADRFATKDEMQLLLNSYLAQNDLDSYSFYFTDFSHFSKQELMTVELVLKKAENTTIGFKTKNGDIDSDVKSGDYDYVVQSTIKKLEHFIQNQNLNYLTSQFENTNAIDKKSILNGLWTKTLYKKGQDLGQFFQPVKADSRYAEAYFVARTIYQQVALNNYRYHDFLVLAPDLNEYETYLTPILRQNKIPFFDDLQKQMKFHPLVIMIENLMQISRRGMQRQNLLSIMKTHLLIPDNYTREEDFQYDVDQLENFALAHGINQNLWNKDLSDFVDAQVIALDDSEEQVQRLNKLRKYFVDSINQLLEELSEIEDPQAGVSKFWDFLIKHGVAQRLDQWRLTASENNDLQLAQQPEQVWTTLNTLLKDYLLLTQEFDIDSFFQLLVTGFSEASFSQIPSSLDAVNISELGMIQNSDYKQVFILGASSSSLPKVENIPGFFTSENIEDINQGSEEENRIEDGQKINNLDQNYQFGLALSLASDKIYISYPVINTANEEITPSIFYKQLLQLTDAKEFEQHSLPRNTSDILTFLTNPQASLGYLTYLNTENIEGSRELLELSEKELPDLTKQILLASEFKNIPEDLTPELAQELYGENIETSVSQLETYYQNSFEYFLNYGLHLRKRFENELDIIQAGNYYHETFDGLVKLLKSKNLDLANLSDVELGKFLNEVQIQLQDKGKYRQLLNDPFNKYLFKKLDQTTSNVAHFWHKNLKKTLFRPHYSELNFGRNQEVKGLSYQLDMPQLHKVDLRGKMDRVDLAKTELGTVGEVIDYKSSAKKFDLSLFANGISLQMVSYLEVLKNNQKFFAQDDELEVLGAFYQTITQKLEKLNKSDNINKDFLVKDIDRKNNQNLMYNGILVANPEILTEIEDGLKEDQAVSDLYNGVKKKKDGNFSFPSNSSFTPDQLDLVLQYNSYLIKKAAHNILSGEIKLNPYSYKNTTSLQYSDFKDIFFFDAMLKENNYHKITSLDKKNLMELIKKTLDL